MNAHHEEWTKENSLTSQEDRDRENKWRPDQGCVKLTNNEVKEAMKELNKTDFIDKFPKVDRVYADPSLPLQTYGLISFTPAKGSTPNKDGVFGFAKLRGNFSSKLEADERAEFLIRKVDSYHKIYHTYVGRPFPITFSSNYSAETNEVDIRKEMADTISSDIKSHKQDDQKTIEEIRQREEKLVEESKQDGEDPFETYITLKVKKSQLEWTYMEHLKKIKEIKKIVLQTRDTLSEMDTQNPDFIKNYFSKYMKARSDAGFKENSSEKSFISYMGEDIKLPGVDSISIDDYLLSLDRFSGAVGDREAASSDAELRADTRTEGCVSTSGGNLDSEEASFSLNLSTS